MFPHDSAKPYLDKLTEYAARENCPNSLKINIFDGTHELDKSEGGINFFLNGLLG
jgi:hypothetical protein